MIQNKISQEEVDEQLDPHFFTDYALFSGAVRNHTVTALEKLFKSSPNDAHRRLLIVGIYREEYAAYEDMGAIIQAFISWRRKEVFHPLTSLCRFVPQSVILSEFFKRKKIHSHLDLYHALELDDWIVPDWLAVHPNINCTKVFQRFCEFVIGDCSTNQNKFGVDAYNKIKHGLTIVPNGRRYLPASPSSPAVLIKNKENGAVDPYVFVSLPMDDLAINERLNVVSFVQATLRALAAFYVIRRYPEILERERKISPAPTLFDSKLMEDVKEFVVQLSNKP